MVFQLLQSDSPKFLEASSLSSSMAEFKLHEEKFNCKVCSTQLTKHQRAQFQQQLQDEEDDRPLLRRRMVVVQLQHCVREIYSVFTSLDEDDGPSEAVVDKKKKVLGRQLIQLEDGGAATDAVNCAKIIGALFALEVKDSVFPWDPVLDQIKALAERTDLHHGAIITVDFLRRKFYRCFEEVADNGR